MVSSFFVQNIVTILLYMLYKNTQNIQNMQRGKIYKNSKLVMRNWLRFHGIVQNGDRRFMKNCENSTIYSKIKT